ncbi:MAG: ExbD/TolR family protein [Pirellulales bacterium]
MKVRNKGGLADKIPVDMTPMIDIVFQLMAFFIMTLKVVLHEGDFNIKMPLAAPGGPPPIGLPPIQVRLVAGGDGRLSSVQMGNRNLGTDFDALRAAVLDIVGQGETSLKDEAEVEIDADFNLRYEYIIRAITSVTGYRGSDGHVVPLVEKIKFATPRPPGG